MTTETVDVVVTFLSLDLLGQTPISATTRSPFELQRTLPSDAAAVAMRMYRDVGDDWSWTDRRAWSESEWDAMVHHDTVEVWLARVDGISAGYFQLHVEADSVELKYFGLLPAFTGRRLGGPLLSAAIARARALGAERMTLNTCTLDHPSALPNYLKRGFNILRTETERRSVAR